MPTLAARTAAATLATLLLTPPSAAKTPKPPAPPVVQAAPRTAARQAPAAPARPATPHAATPRRHPTAAKPAVKPPTSAPAVVPAPELPAEPQKGTNTGLPLPRFGALRSDEVNFRSGPGTRYPIEWVYKRRDLPVQIEREFELWRLVRDQDGTKGWVNQATLAPRRTAIVTGAEQVLRRDARDDASPVARLKPGVIVRLRACEATSPWCQAQVGDYRGWMKRTELWGVSPDEAIQ
mgnify:CR=1 FL=1